MSNLEILQESIIDVQKKGITYGDLFSQSSSNHKVFFEDGSTEEIGSSSVRGTGVRLLKDGHSIYVHKPGAEFSTALKCIGEIANGESYGNVPGKDTKKTILHPLPRLKSPDYSFLFDVDAYLRRRSKRIQQVSMNYSTSKKNILVIRGDGAICRDLREYTIFGVNVVVEKEGSIQTGYEVAAASVPVAEFWSSRDPVELAEEALEHALTMLDAPPCPAGTMPVILSGEAGGTMVHEACGHGLEADIVQRDFSVYRDKIGNMVATPQVTLIDDGTKDGMYGTSRYDDEGVLSQKTTLIKEGRLIGYLTDVETSRAMELPLTGNGRRASYRSLPIPRMTNTFIMPGRDTPEEILQQVDNGLFVKKMGGGEVTPTSGDFVFHVTEGYIIRNGKVTSPVRGAILTGNGPEVLQNILAVGNDLHFEPGMCGKSGQSVPVTDGQPTLLIRQIVVGGSDFSNGIS